MERAQISLPRSEGTGRLATIACLLALVFARPGVALGQAPRDGGGSLARYVPRQDNLFCYLEFDGLDAHEAAWKNSSAYRLLNDTKLGPLLDDLAGQVLGLIPQSGPPDEPIRPAELLGQFQFKHAARRGFAVGAWARINGQADTSSSCATRIDPR